jgi:UDP-N-acetylglucosamine 4,6-dehydratase
MTKKQVGSYLNGKSVLVTGATGSFGRQFVRTALEEFNLERLVVFSRDELKQYEMQQDPGCQSDIMRYFIGDVRDLSRLEMAMRGIDVVIHAAALKQVPAAEYNPFECIRTNVHGAENVVVAAIRSGVQKVVALSTDKAANPINLYGASKLASDKIFTAANNLSGSAQTKFSVVRYGNVLGSRGSVVPYFRRLIAGGTDHIPITDPEMTRFWITVEQGVNFVLSCAAMMAGTEVFVPKIPSMKLTDLAASIAPDLPQRTIGIRPGEKIHEVLVTSDDGRNTFDLGDRLVIGPSFLDWPEDVIRSNGGVPVETGFSYTSDTNSEWLDKATLKEWLARN